MKGEQSPQPPRLEIPFVRIEMVKADIQIPSIPAGARLYPNMFLILPLLGIVWR